MPQAGDGGIACSWPEYRAACAFVNGETGASTLLARRRFEAPHFEQNLFACAAARA